MANLNENTLAEQPVIEWLKGLGYEYAFGPEISPGGPFMERSDYRQPVLEERLKRSLKRINPDIPDNVLSQVFNQVAKYHHPDLEMGNKEIYEMITRGISVDVKNEKGEIKGKIAKIIDFDHLENNEFLVVNQYTVQGDSVRIPDVVIFINGLPVVIFELKSPTREKATIADAYGQIHDTYKKEVPKIFSITKSWS